MHLHISRIINYNPKNTILNTSNLLKRLISVFNCDQLLLVNDTCHNTKLTVKLVCLPNTYIYIYIYRLKCRFCYCYAFIKPHQQLNYLPIFNTFSLIFLFYFIFINLSSYNYTSSNIFPSFVPFHFPTTLYLLFFNVNFIISLVYHMQQSLPNIIFPLHNL